MTQIYCTALDLVSHANKARLLTQLAGNDYGTVPTAQAVMQYMTHGTADTDETGKAELERIKVRIEQAIEQSASEINGYLAMMPTLSANIPTATLSTINVDLAMARLFETLSDDSTVKTQADRWLAWFDKLATGKIAMSTWPIITPSGGAVVATTPSVWTQEALNGY